MNQPGGGKGPRAGMEQPGDTSLPERPPGALTGWVMFDWAQQPFYTLVTSFLFAPYFVNVFVGDPVGGQAIWGYATALAGLIVAFVSPVFGAMSDQSGRRKPWVLLFSVLLVIPTALLWFAAPGAEHLVIPILAAFVVATVAAEATTVFINAMMPSLVTSQYLGRLSGIGWAVGYIGGLVSLVVMAGFIVTTPESGKTLLGLEPIIAFDNTTRQADRFVGPFSALWYIVFVLPFFLLTPDTPSRAKASIADGVRGVLATIREVRAFKTIVIFLLARMFYIDGLLAIFSFGAIYGASIFAWQSLELGAFGILLTITGAIGAVVGGYLDDRAGPKPVIQIALLVLIVSAFGILSVTRETILFGIETTGPRENDGLFASTPERLYLAFAAIVGLVAGPLQSSSRSLMARLAPPDRMTQFFGLFAFSGKITSFVAPLVVAGVTTMTGDQRIGIASITLFLLTGFALMFAVHGKKPA